MRGFFRWYDRLLDLCGFVGAGLICLAAVATVVDAAMRNFEIGYGIAGIVELTEYGLSFLTLIGAAWVLRARGHISIDILIDALPERGRRIAQYCIYAAMLAISLALVVAGGLATLRSIRTGHLVSKTYTFPEWWLQILLPAAGLLLAVECFRRLSGHAAPDGGDTRADNSHVR